MFPEEEHRSKSERGSDEGRGGLGVCARGGDDARAQRRAAAGGGSQRSAGDASTRPAPSPDTAHSMLHESWPAAWHKADSFELDALFAEVNNNCSKEGEAECGAEGSGGDAESPPPLPPFGYAHPGALSPSHSRSYQELRPAAAHARDMQAYAHLEEVFKPGSAAPAAPAGSTDGVYLRRSSPDLSPSPERRDDFRAHYEPYTPAPAPPAYAHDHHHHVDGIQYSLGLGIRLCVDAAGSLLPDSFTCYLQLELPMILARHTSVVHGSAFVKKPSHRFPA
ncbi:hypothetical protein HF086_006666 [Spodoptera exigua]|uniref:Uncharacterized protein n=1 Tax=Spodoptera exigua TaxID=7107 RepID=A0A922MU94_SPOEX|nr:hypothetical protein HF086_006666 [Spodoptera exigua]